MTFELMELLLLALLGALAGFINTMAAGGSTITLPAMILMGMDGPLANGTNRLAILAQTIVSSSGFFRKGIRDLGLSFSLALCALPGALLGAWVGTRFGGIWFNRLLAAIMVTILLLLMGDRKGRQGSRYRAPLDGAIPRARLATAHVLMVLVGLYGGFIQAGVGFLLMAVLHRILGQDLVRVNMHKGVIVGIYTLGALLIFAGEGAVHWYAGLFLATGNALGGWVGAHVSIHKGENVIRRFVLGAIIFMALKLLWG